MSTVENKNLVRNFFSLLTRNDIKAVGDMLDDGLVWWSAGGSLFPFAGTKSKSEFLQVTGGILDMFPQGYAFELTGMVAEDDSVAVEVKGHAVTVDGRNYDNLLHFLFKFKNGKIVSAKEYMDTLYAKTILIDGGTGHA